MVYSFVISSLMAAWHMRRDQAGLLGTAVLLISAIGGWLAGTLADRFGRARILQLTILWFAFFTFLSGFTHSFWQLLITRGLQGLGFGGEWAVGSVLMGETIRAQHRGKAVGTVQGGWAIGWGLAALCYGLFFTVLPESTGLAGHVLDRHPSRPAGLLHPPQSARAKSLMRKRARRLPPPARALHSCTSSRWTS